MKKLLNFGKERRKKKKNVLVKRLVLANCKQRTWSMAVR
jgi:hypothetical protein